MTNTNELFDYHSQCLTCNLSESLIHDLHEKSYQGYPYTELSRLLANEHDITISSDALSNHIRFHARKQDKINTEKTEPQTLLGVGTPVKPPKGWEPSLELDEDGGTFVTPPQENDKLSDFSALIREAGEDPDDYSVAIERIGKYQIFSGEWRTSYKVKLEKKYADGGAGTGSNDPLWPVIQPATPVTVSIITELPRPVRDKKLAMKCADTQIGFRRFSDGTLDPFHDSRAMDIFIKVCHQYQPDKIQILGDFLDLASQGRWAQEASFAETTQRSLDAGHGFLAALRGVCPDAQIVVIEGNHDKRMQNFIETNALAAFGLKRASMPESWPVMSLPYLLRLDELGVEYVDAYPAATDWDNATTRNIHGTKSNSKGSTTAQYVSEIPHLNTWAGHSHRLEVTYRSTLGPQGVAVESYSANPGCLCRVDGAVPGVNGAIGADGRPAQIVENWQQGFGMAYYNDTESWPFVYRIREGRSIVDGQEIVSE